MVCFGEFQFPTFPYQQFFLFHHNHYFHLISYIFFLKHRCAWVQGHLLAHGQPLRCDNPTFLLPLSSLSSHPKLTSIPLCQPPYLETLSSWDSQWPHQAGTQISDSYCPFRPPLQSLRSHSQRCKVLNCVGFLKSLFIELTKNKKHTGEREEMGQY